MRLKEMLKAAKMKKHNFPDEAIRQFEDIMLYDEADWKNVCDSVEHKFVSKMDELLTEEQRLLLHEYGGSCRGGETGRQAKVLAEELAGKPLAEKIELMNQNDHMYRTKLNDDGTITAYCGCHCLQRRVKKPETAKLPSAYGCAAGAALHNLKTALCVNAKIKSIDYPKEGDGKEDMTFVFEIVA